MAWSLIYLVYSFRSPLPWHVDEDVAGDEILQPASNFFGNDVLMATAADDDAGVIVGYVSFNFDEIPPFQYNEPN